MGCHRKPRTTQERRANGKRGFLEINDYKIKLRPNRSMSNLVEAWDDLMFSYWGHRSWKRHRKTQWKQNKKSVMANDTSFMEVSDAHTKYLGVSTYAETQTTNSGNDPYTG